MNYIKHLYWLLCKRLYHKVLSRIHPFKKRRFHHMIRSAMITTFIYDMFEKYAMIQGKVCSSKMEIFFTEEVLKYLEEWENNKE